jgi:hypothetical protein
VGILVQTNAGRMPSAKHVELASRMLRDEKLAVSLAAGRSYMSLAYFDQLYQGQAKLMNIARW